MNDKPRFQFSIVQLLMGVIIISLCVGLLMLGKANWAMQEENEKLQNFRKEASEFHEKTLVLQEKLTAAKDEAEHQIAETLRQKAEWAEAMRQRALPEITGDFVERPFEIKGSPIKDEKIRRDYQHWQESPFKRIRFQKHPPYDRIRPFKTER